MSGMELAALLCNWIDNFLSTDLSLNLNGSLPARREVLLEKSGRESL